jgi:hypothetical protein
MWITITRLDRPVNRKVSRAFANQTFTKELRSSLSRRQERGGVRARGNPIGVEKRLHPAARTRRISGRAKFLFTIDEINLRLLSSSVHPIFELD